MERLERPERPERVERVERLGRGLQEPVATACYSNWNYDSFQILYIESYKYQFLPRVVL